ncbi:Ribonuclease H-like superfamily protein [Striga hermonthica]|uniref:Ribonuclease H-like superfamily protein n=1 Tax=Striga hermonthica TaxID=68872 RepID=A0A9N7R525_STRHE|nr:Ribonuclease H-like superfamily protein [Striga hermonthica]
MHWLSWDKLVVPKSEGGLGFKDLKLFNKALILKQLWRLIEQPDLLMSRILRHKYFNDCSIFEWQNTGGASWLWSSWASFLPVLQKFTRITIRDGQSTRLNDSNWVSGHHSVKPELRVGVDGNLFKVKVLLLAGGVQWDSTLVRALFAPEVEVVGLLSTLCEKADQRWGQMVERIGVQHDAKEQQKVLYEALKNIPMLTTEQKFIVAKYFCRNKEDMDVFFSVDEEEKASMVKMILENKL